MRSAAPIGPSRTQPRTHTHAAVSGRMTARTSRSPLLRHGTNARSANHRRTHDDDDDVEDDSLQLSIPWKRGDVKTLAGH